nr:hypothetical protein [Desulfobacterales bacterium]
SALVSGSKIYKVAIEIKPLAKPRWTDIKRRCAGRIDSLVELLKGSISRGVMEIVTRKGEGLFPAPQEIALSCSCPDWATMCKHVAATLYGVGARLDHAPEMLFTLRGVDPAEMVEAAVAQPSKTYKSRKGRTLVSEDLSAVFGIDIDTQGGSEESVTPPVDTQGGSEESVTPPARGGRRPVQSPKTAKRSPAARKPASRRSPS